MRKVRSSGEYSIAGTDVVPTVHHRRLYIFTNVMHVTPVQFDHFRDRSHPLTSLVNTLDEGHALNLDYFSCVSSFQA